MLSNSMKHYRCWSRGVLIGGVRRWMRTTPRRIRVVAYEQWDTYSTDAGISKLSRSVRTKIYPVFSGAGRSLRLTSTPVCNPTPLIFTALQIVVWFIARRIAINLRADEILCRNG
jgi:hypothetical protein